jgi:hypothetical protein
MQSAAARTFRHSNRDASATQAQNRAASPAAEQPKHAPMGCFYIHNGYPMKGSSVDRDGSMTLLLQCFPIPAGATPGQTRDMKFTLEDAVYIQYHGLVSRHGHRDRGIVIGYVDQCYGDKQGARSMYNIHDTTMRETRATYLARPQVSIPLDGHRFGEYQHMVASTDKIIELYARADEIRSPKPKPPVPRRSIA